jgi:hypothetical protein
VQDVAKEDRQQLLVSMYKGGRVHGYELEIHLKDMKAEALLQRTDRMSL